MTRFIWAQDEDGAIQYLYFDACYATEKEARDDAKYKCSGRNIAEDTGSKAKLYKIEIKALS